MFLSSMKKEKLFKSIIDKLSLAGKSGEGLYFIDKELSTLEHTKLMLSGGRFTAAVSNQ